MPEAARAVLDHAFREMGCDMITVFHHPENIRSRRVIEKLGFLRRGYKIYLGDLQLRYELTREDYLSTSSLRGRL
jgi:putative acetyltransferase